MCIRERVQFCLEKKPIPQVTWMYVYNTLCKRLCIIVYITIQIILYSILYITLYSTVYSIVSIILVRRQRGLCSWQNWPNFLTPAYRGGVGGGWQIGLPKENFSNALEFSQKKMDAQQQGGKKSKINLNQLSLFQNKGNIYLV